MRRQQPIAHVLHGYLFPHPTPADPPSFAAHLARNLVPEVRIEVATFYGDLASEEARYPGLDYCHAPHRMRLGRFKHHRRLFEAFDALGLTYQEIQNFCCWEGSRWARLKYEEDRGQKVMDTTGDEIGPWVDRRRVSIPKTMQDRRHSITRKTDISVVIEQPSHLQHLAQLDRDDHIQDVAQPDRDVQMMDSWSAENEQPSVPDLSSRNGSNRQSLRRLNDRLRTAARRAEPFPADLEAMIKEHFDRGELDSRTLQTLMQAREYSRIAQYRARIVANNVNVDAPVLVNARTTA